MSQYALKYTDGRVIEITADNDAAAERAAMARFNSSAVAGDWEGDIGGTSARMLIWASEDDSVDDDGSNAVAALTVTR